jgi:hypothetical protein
MCKESFCYVCKMDCKTTYCPSDCENFILAPTNKEYWDGIKELNVDLKKLCNKKKLNYGFMMKMLKGREVWKYKYHCALIGVLYENEEYVKYLERFDGEE